MNTDDVRISITNPDGSIVLPFVIGGISYDEYLDRPRRLQIKIEKGSSLDPQGKVSVTKTGKIIFLGHVTKYDNSNPEYDSLTLDSAEYLLDQRIGQFYRYPAGTTLNNMLASSMGGTVVGLLAQANGLVPRGSFVLHAGNVYKWVGMGTASRIGTITALYQNTTLLAKKNVIPAAAASWYQSETDLYVWTSDDKDPNYHMIIIPNFKDTLIRLGTLARGTSKFTVCFEVGASKQFPTIKALMLASGQEWSIRYEKDGYAYLDGVVTVGKGSLTVPVATYINGKNAEITIGQADGLGKIQALLGQGAGAGMSQQCSASVDTLTRGTWREAVFQAGGLFGAMLRTATAKVFSDAADPTIYNIRLVEQDWSQSVGNYIRIIRDGYQPTVTRIKHIQMKQAGDMLIEAGQRLRTLQELLKSGDEVQQILSSFYGSHTKNAWSWSLPETNIDSFAAISHQFLLASSDDSTKSSTDKTIGSGEIDPNFPFMVLLSLRVGWFSSATNQATNPDQPHGNVGSHSGYGGGSQSKPQTKHSVPQVTGLPQSATKISVCNATSFSYSSSTGGADIGAHIHGVGITFQGSCYVSPSSHYGDCWGAGSGQATLGGGSYHYHNYAMSVNLPYVMADPGGHVHIMPGHFTNDSDSQSHEWGGAYGGGDAKTRAGSALHPEWDARLDGLVKKYSTKRPAQTGLFDIEGSITYLTVDVKVNNVRVPGSPFSGEHGTGLYIGDSLGPIDISNLVTVGIKNTISLAITEFNGSNVVRCSLSGNVNVSAIISAF